MSGESDQLTDPATAETFAGKSDGIPDSKPAASSRPATSTAGSVSGSVVGAGEDATARRQGTRVSAAASTDAASPVTAAGSVSGSVVGARPIVGAPIPARTTTDILEDGHLSVERAYWLAKNGPDPYRGDRMGPEIPKYGNRPLFACDAEPDFTIDKIEVIDRITGRPILIPHDKVFLYTDDHDDGPEPEREKGEQHDCWKKAVAHFKSQATMEKGSLNKGKPLEITYEFKESNEDQRRKFLSDMRDWPLYEPTYTGHTNPWAPELPPNVKEVPATIEFRAASYDQNDKLLSPQRVSRIDPLPSPPLPDEYAETEYDPPDAWVEPFPNNTNYYPSRASEHMSFFKSLPQCVQYLYHIHKIDTPHPRCNTFKAMLQDSSEEKRRDLQECSGEGVFQFTKRQYYIEEDRLRSKVPSLDDERAIMTIESTTDLSRHIKWVMPPTTSDGILPEDVGKYHSHCVKTGSLFLIPDRPLRDYTKFQDVDY